MYAVDEEEKLLRSFENSHVADRLAISKWTVWFTPVQVNDEGDPYEKATFLWSSNMKDRVILLNILR